jgi:hypothetical protein
MRFIYTFALIRISLNKNETSLLKAFLGNRPALHLN